MKNRKCWNTNDVANIGLLVLGIVELIHTVYVQHKPAEIIEFTPRQSDDPWEFEKDLKIFDDFIAQQPAAHKDMKHMEQFLKENEEWMLERGIPFPDYYDLENHCVV